MSQFVLVTGSQAGAGQTGIRFRGVRIDAEELPDRVARAMPELREGSIWSVEDDMTKSSDHLFVEAQKDLAEGNAFRETRLGGLLTGLVKTADHIVLWYADDWRDLPQITEAEEFIRLVEHDLTRGAGEIYLHFIRQSD
jgi:hypothetical protein